MSGILLFYFCALLLCEELVSGIHFSIFTICCAIRFIDRTLEVIIVNVAL